MESSPLRYAYSLRAFHGLVAFGTLSTFAFVQMAKRTEDKPKKSSLMKYHKSFGLLATSFIAGFIYNRFFKKSKNNKKKVPEAIPGPGWQQTAAKLSFFGLYSCMIFMPITGIAMGYFGGWGIPFFMFNIPGTSTPNKSLANNAYFSHKKVGKVFEGLVCLHTAATAYHIFIQGDDIINRINPFDGDQEDENE